LDAIVFVLLWRLDLFVNGTLYDFGLQFSFNWVADYWYYTGLLGGFLFGSTALSALSIIPHYQYSQKPSRTSKILAFVLPALSIAYMATSIYSLRQIDTLLQNRLIEHGLPTNFNWGNSYNPTSASALTLMVVALIALIKPAIRTLEIIKIEIIQED
jgi:hypothetical protein